MRVYLQDSVLYIHRDDVPAYNKTGSTVRNTYFWALRSIADRSRRDRNWEYEASVWVALGRLLNSFAESGYLGYRETLLEFAPNAEIPPILKPVATWDDRAVDFTAIE